MTRRRHRLGTELVSLGMLNKARKNAVLSIGEAMRRRDFITLIFSAAAEVWPLAVRAQQSAIPERSASLNARPRFRGACHRAGLSLTIRTLELVRKINHPDVFSHAHADCFPFRRQHVLAMP
jgi:hypothetical protein